MRVAAQHNTFVLLLIDANQPGLTYLGGAKARGTFDFSVGT